MSMQETQGLRSIIVNDHEITYDIHGDADGPSVLLVSGWCQDYRLFKYVVDKLAQNHKVIRINWRGHSDPSTEILDFGVAEQASDVIAVLDALGIDQVIPVSTSHGGWANIELCERLGTARVPRSIVIDWIMIEASEGFIHDLQVSQTEVHWVQGRQNLFDLWLGVSHNEAISNHLNKEMAAFGYDMWSRSCRVIENAYKKWGSPLKRMAALTEKRPIIHVYSQAPVEGYEEMQDQFISEHLWFGYRHINGQTHFPTLESPQETAHEISNFVKAV
ncbi:alpha/beta hydrolase [Paenibacillus sp. N1-5-1-14]|uniref:alpha/beta fold hydrolase n=1 Tax=Paenibacillus radicibacter TaxID=2972488 RepID=UPI0021596D50|nr:alpha/beta hydrolase [Paenibacillus radicibacter]MCR8644498.1 alpha/beta hydrolase [Paenibacillus radicibacter]